MYQTEAAQNHLRQMNVVAGAILAGILVFSGVVWFLLGSGGFPPQDLELPSWTGTLANVVALVALGKALLLPRIFRAPGPGGSEEAILAWHRKTVIVGFALREAAAFVALVGAMLTGQLTGAFLMVGLALFTMVLAWPRADQLSLTKGP